MSKVSKKAPAVRTAMSDEFRLLSTATILFHQAIADRLGMHVTDHKCAEILLHAGPITAGDLAERTGLTTGAVTGVIDRLEKAGFARRAKDPSDRRRVIIEPLPDKIEEEIGPLFGPIGQAMSKLCKQYSAPQLEIVRDFIERFTQIAQDEAHKLREAVSDSKTSDAKLQSKSA